MRSWLLLLLTFLVGLGIGVAGALLAPRWVDPYLPEAIRAEVERVEGEVTRKLKEEDRLLLTVVTAQGSILATFRKKVPEIDLLVEQRDLVTLALRRYEPFVDDPVIERVRKGTPMRQPESAGPASPSTGEEAETEQAPR